MSHWTESPETPQTRGRKREKSNIERIGGRVTPASGAIDGIDGDGSIKHFAPEQHEFLIEHKYTEAKSFRLDRGTLDKIAGEAGRANRRPVLMLEFKDGETYLIFRLCDTEWEE